MVLEWPNDYSDLPGEMLADKDYQPIGVFASVPNPGAMAWTQRNKRARGLGGVSQFDTSIVATGNVLDGAPYVAEIVDTTTGDITRTFNGILTDRQGWEVWLRRDGVNDVIFASTTGTVENDTITKDGVERGWRLDVGNTIWREIKVGDPGALAITTGTEFETGETIDGAIVYGVWTDMGAGLNSASKLVAHGITGITRILEVFLSADNGAGVSYTITLTADETCFRATTNVQWVTTSDRTAFTGRALMRYFK